MDYRGAHKMGELNPYKVIESLSCEDALAVLKRLAAEDEQLAQRIVELTKAHLEQVEPEGVGFELYDELCMLEIEDAWDRAGPSRHGYVEPWEVAYEMIEGVLEPFLEELKKYQSLGMYAEANQFCMGLLLGLYKFQYECKSQFRDWTPDAGIEFADSVLDAWKEGIGSREDFTAVRAFIEEELCGWEHLLKSEF
jgi:hypothetical protein